MKISIEIDRLDKLILHILYASTEGTGYYVFREEPLPYVQLERIFEAIQDSESELDTSHFIKLVAGREKTDHYNFDKPKKSELDQHLERLWHLNLVKRSYTDNGLRNVTRTNYESSKYDHAFSLTEEGIRAAKALNENREIILRPPKKLQTTVFVACAFGYSEIEALYSECFEPLCFELGYKPIRVDMTEPARSITDAILVGITEAACVIADLTYARPSVYFEVGFAHGLQVPLLLTARKDHYRGEGDGDRVHFDLEQYKISFWSKAKDDVFKWKKGMNVQGRLQKLVPPLG